MTIPVLQCGDPDGYATPQLGIIWTQKRSILIQIVKIFSGCTVLLVSVVNCREHELPIFLLSRSPMNFLTIFEGAHNSLLSQSQIYICFLCIGFILHKDIHNTRNEWIYIYILKTQIKRKGLICAYRYTDLCNIY